MVLSHIPPVSSKTPGTHFAVVLFHQLFLSLYLFIWFLLPLLSTSHLPLLSFLLDLRMFLQFIEAVLNSERIF